MLNSVRRYFSEFFQAISYFICWSFLTVIFVPFFKIKVYGGENIPKKGRLIFAANHQNFFDGYFITFGYGPLKLTHVIAKRALKFRVFSYIFKSIGSVLFSSSIEDYHKGLKKLRNILLSEGRIVIFPEGNVSSSNTPKRFKAGVAKLAIDTQTSVIPVYITGSYDVRYLKSWFKRNEIKVVIGKPIQLYNYAAAYNFDLVKVSSILHDEIIDLSKLFFCDSSSAASEVIPKRAAFQSIIPQTDPVLKHPVMDR